ncbi:MAG: hypothetical protein JWM80_6588 [Cyanobacteria bacterium RYN_339]|nr:hypothetical protein [Cyanobacteria bacterium RYN_339]
MNRYNLAVLALIVVSGCQAPTPAAGGGSLAYSSVLKMRAADFQKIDTNHDCALTKAEFQAWETGANPTASPWEGAWQNADRDGDGLQTAAEWLGKDALAVSSCKDVSPPPGKPPAASPSPLPPAGP